MSQAVAAVHEVREPSAKYLVQGAEQAQPLVQHFNLLATSPGGVARLRELILTLAVQGKLVPQDPSDEPASELLKKIRAEKDRLIAEGKIKRDKPLAEIAEEEKPFDIPRDWEWVKGRNLYSVIRGITYQKNDARDTPTETHLPILRANNIRGSINLDDLVYVPSALISAEQLLRTGDYLVCLASGSKNLVGKAAPFSEALECSFGAFCGALRPFQETAYFAVYLASPLYRDSVSEASAGIGINNLKGSSLLDLDVPLPPLAEQSRIVARVEELMRLCDALEAKGKLEAEQHARLVNTLLSTLTQSESPEALAESWQRVAAHFDLLLDRPEAVDALEQTILQLAVRGLLVPQDTEDEPASELLKKIRKEKDQLIAQGKIKRDKPLPPIAEDEKPFEVPQGWEWTPLGQVTSLVTSGSRGWKDFYSKDGATFIRSQDIKYDRLEFDDRAFVKLPNGIEGVRTQVRLHDLLITITGANVGKAAVVAQSIPEAYVSQHVALVRLFDVRFADYLHLWLVSEHEGRKLLLTSSYGAKPGLNLNNISDLLIPLPPLAEQSRIVTRVNELRRLCADLRQRLSAQQKLQTQLAEALVAG